MSKLTQSQLRWLKDLPKKRVEYPNNCIGWWKDVMRQRIEKSKELVSFRFFRGDCHSHSVFSDGIGTIPEIKSWVDRAGLDFFFVTDHYTTRQKMQCKKHGLWWGQEPPTQHHHLLIIGIDRTYKVKRDLVYDYNKVKECGAFPVIAHPAGWFPRTRYNQEQMDALNLLGDEFAMEIINGANNIFNCFDETDAKAIELWDHHLSRGKRVVALGNTDAHLPQAIGDVWNGVFCDSCTKENVMAALGAGHLFVSDAPLLNLQCGKVAMGDLIKMSGEDARPTIEFQYEAADSIGLSTVRLISQGKVVKTVNARGKTHSAGRWNVSTRGKRYFRSEAFATDGRRAYTNPIYVREK